MIFDCGNQLGLEKNQIESMQLEYGSYLHAFLTVYIFENRTD